MDRSWKRDGDPPIDGSAECPMCPHQIRNLLAVVHNFVTHLDGNRSHKFNSDVQAMRDALSECQPIADAHFADSMHSLTEW